MNKAAVGLMLFLVGAAAFRDAQSGERSAIWTPPGPRAGLAASGELQLSYQPKC